MIEIKGLEKHFSDKKVIENFSLFIAPTMRIALISSSGSGKTTLLRIISGLDRRYKGTVMTKGKVSYMFQEDRLFSESTVLENVSAVCDSNEIAEKLLSAVELSECRDIFPRELSGGMKRRVALARSLAYPFDILLLDEPFTGLDEETKERVAKNILPYLEAKTVVLVTHSPDEAELLGCDVLRLDNGFIK